MTSFRISIEYNFRIEYNSNFIFIFYLLIETLTVNYLFVPVLTADTPQSSKDFQCNGPLFSFSFFFLLPIFQEKLFSKLLEKSFNSNLEIAVWRYGSEID